LRARSSGGGGDAEGLRAGERRGAQRRVRGIASASRDTALASSGGADLLEQVEPVVARRASVPRATFDLRLQQRCTGANPLASLRLEDGQWTTGSRAAKAAGFLGADVTE